MTSQRKTLTFTDAETYREAWLTPGPRIIKPAEELAWQTIEASVQVEGDDLGDVVYEADDVPVAIYGSTRLKGLKDVGIYGYRGGEAMGANGDNLSLFACERFELERFEVWHGTDENLSIFAACKDGVVREGISHSALSNGGHPEGEHSKGFQITGSSGGRFPGFPDQILVEECLFALNVARNPNCGGDADSNGGKITLRRLVIFAWQDFGIHAMRGCTVSAEEILGIHSRDQGEVGPLLLANHGGEIQSRAVFEMKDLRDVECLSGERRRNRRAAWRRVRNLRSEMRSWGPKPHSTGLRNLLAQVETMRGVAGVPDHQHHNPELFP